MRIDGRWVSCCLVGALVAITLLRTTTAAAQAFPVVINEIHYNPDGPEDLEEYVELHNTGGDALDIGGWAFTQGITFLFPGGTTIPSGGFVVVAANPGLVQAHGAQVLGPFIGSLANGGETLTLRTGADQIVDLVDWNDKAPWPLAADGEGASLQRRSGALDSNDPFTWGAGPPTPGEASDIPPAAPPVIDPPRGVHTNGVTVTMTAPTDGSTIRYTTNGTEPTAGSQAYGGPIAIDDNTTVKAAAFIGNEPSTIVTNTYLVLSDVLTQPEMDPQVTEGARYGNRIEPSLLDAPAVHISSAQGPVDPEYRPATIEWLDPSGGETFEIEAGWKIFGGLSIRDTKKNYRLKFSDEFGPDRLDFDFYEDYAVAAGLGILPVDGFDQIELRHGSGDSNHRATARDNGLQMRNPMADDTMLAMGIPSPHNRYVHVYINHEYRGLYTLRERFDADFMASYFGGNDDDYDAINKNLAYDGTNARWDDMTSNATYGNVVPSLDIDAFADFMVYNFYNGTLDWNPNKNWAAAGPSDPAHRASWIFYNKDHDNGFFRRQGIDTDITAQLGPGGLFGSLVAEAHPDFMQALRDSIGRNLFDGGPLTAGPIRQRMDYRADQVESLLIADSARWGTCDQLCNNRDKSLWDPDDEWRTHLAYLRADIIPVRTDLALDQLRAKGWYPVERPAASALDALVGESVTISTRDGSGRILYTTDGSDPRLVGGAVSPRAVSVLGVSSVEVPITGPTLITARVRRNSQWSSPMVWEIAAGAAPAMILNEWNAVSGSSTPAAADPALGLVEGNGGDWFEVVVIEDHLDARGWSFALTDDGVPTDTLTLSDAALWSDLRSGTIITISEDIETDTSYDPESGDWTINVQAAAAGDDTWITQENFVVTHSNWQLKILDDAGLTRFGPTGEGVAPVDGIGEDQIGELEADPSAAITPQSAYGSGNGSTFGAPNTFAGTFQDFFPLRSAALGVGRGDVDHSLTIDETDLRILIDELAGFDLGMDYGAADVDENGAVDLLDALILAQQLAG